mgnify:FL=1
MLVKFVGCDTEGTTYESQDLKSREDICKVDNAVQKLISEDYLETHSEEETVLEAFRICGFSAKKVNVVCVMM